MLDSGAYSAWINHTPLKVEGYAEYCKANEHLVDYIINLDVIPGIYGDKKRLSSLDVEAAAIQGWNNYEYMLAQGIPKEKLIHVFHQNDDVKWLEKMLEFGMTFIGISPANDSSTKQRIAWLDSIMPLLCDDRGFPHTKFHGFAATSVILMVRFPWFSVDSTSWVKFSRFGTIYVPHIDKHGKYKYNKRPWMIFTSTRSRMLKIKEARHIENFSPMVQGAILEYIKSKGFCIGVSEFEEVSDNYKLKKNETWSDQTKGQKEIEIILERGVANHFLERDRLNLIYFMDLEKSFKPWPNRPWKKTKLVSMWS